MIDELYQIPAGGDPSHQTLVDQVTELEQELRNVEFRLHYLFGQRNDTRDALASARGHLARFNNKK